MQLIVNISLLLCQALLVFGTFSHAWAGQSPFDEIASHMADSPSTEMFPMPSGGRALISPLDEIVSDTAGSPSSLMPLGGWVMRSPLDEIAGIASGSSIDIEYFYPIFSERANFFQGIMTTEERLFSDGYELLDLEMSGVSELREAINAYSYLDDCNVRREEFSIRKASTAIYKALSVDLGVYLNAWQEFESKLKIYKNAYMVRYEKLQKKLNQMGDRYKHLCLTDAQDSFSMRLHGLDRTMARSIVPLPNLKRKKVEIKQNSDAFLMHASEYFPRDVTIKTFDPFSLVSLSDRSNASIATEALAMALRYADVVIGEGSHSHGSPKKFLIDNMGLLANNGAVLALEHVFRIPYQSMLDQALVNGELDAVLELFLQELDKGHKIKDNRYGYLALVRAAIDHGVRVIAAETMLAHDAGFDEELGLLSDENKKKRLTAFNCFEALIVDFERRDARTVVHFVGYQHVHTRMGIPGIAEFFHHAPTIVVGDADHEGLHFGVRHSSRAPSGVDADLLILEQAPS